MIEKFLPLDSALARALLTPGAVRERAHAMLALAEDGKLGHWRVERARLPAAADYVIETMRRNYPSLDIPFHARWRHFGAGGVDRWAALNARADWKDAAQRGRAACDLAIVSVLLDAGAGAAWRYRNREGEFSRSEGLAVASFDMFASGVFSADPGAPFRADGARLATLSAADLAKGFQAGADNPLIGLDGRAALLRSLGETVVAAPLVFGLADPPRPGGLFDYLVARASMSFPARRAKLAEGRGSSISARRSGFPSPRAPSERSAGNDTKVSHGSLALPAPAILDAVLTHLGPIWPSRLWLAGVPLGDCWRHPALERDDATNGLVPFHKLSQWLSYSLIEPLQGAGVEVTEIDGLTGLPEYRNGGLFMDMGAIVLKRPEEASMPHEPASLLVVEWRALTVALLDMVAGLIREKLGLDAERLPLAKVLEGGTWAAGRRIAREKRADGSPPLTIISDGTVF